MTSVAFGLLSQYMSTVSVRAVGTSGARSAQARLVSPAKETNVFATTTKSSIVVASRCLWSTAHLVPEADQPYGHSGESLLCGHVADGLWHACLCTAAALLPPVPMLSRARSWEPCACLFMLTANVATTWIHHAHGHILPFICHRSFASNPQGNLVCLLT